MTQSPVEQDKDLLGVDQTYFVREMYTDPAAVSPNIQAYTSDVIYYIFYGSRSILRSLTIGQGLDESSASAAITSSFTMARKLLLNIHTSILSSELIINDAYMSSNKLFIKLTLQVTTSDGKISVKKEVSIGRNYV